MRKMMLLIAVFFSFAPTRAQTPKEIIQSVNTVFGRVKDYSAEISMDFAIPGVTIQPIRGKVFYKAPEKFRVKTNGIVFLPKQNPYYALALLKDTTAYTAVSGGTEAVQNTACAVVNVIPNGTSDLILGKFWLDTKRKVVLRSQLTTKSNGTISIENTYGAMISYGLPENIQFTIDVTRFKVPKAVAVDLNSKSAPKSDTAAKGTGVITLKFSNYALNQKLSDEVFQEK